MPLTQEERATLAKGSLTGLSVGDAFGDQFFVLANRRLSAETDAPPAPWSWSDDTEMACSVVDVLNRRGEVDQDLLAESFAARMDVGRRYGAGAYELLTRIQNGDHWHRASRELFDGRGSYGNGAAMRIAPLGAFFSDDPARAAEQAALSAEVTHANPEGVAGAVAVAAATAHAAAGRGARIAPRELIEAALEWTTTGEYVRRGLRRALRLLGKSPRDAAYELGNGNRISAQDTVPYVLWAAATRLTDYEAAVRACVAVGGDMDTTAAMTGGIVAAHLGPEAVPAAWLAAREPLPDWLVLPEAAS
ncbi:ADP-ribosylglycohydrolase family protein [Actinomadura chibensis]|uniref:ADP-ribosylglycohydrolase family protein n=1 Tax=Actinomadura chibensis TaxID=392828 RepID=A0A5D0NQW6_9ACTN|nr:ADP-ribosylglycohydrolase family protein [Actinomadura chibensis]TYB46481.1 ADP-ribosylglycohydrolase family protein [Actinomadura chibensis]